ncbi:MAG: carboxypeptidase regulatory-like domain-containing protein, partial [Bacteroidales bacterium]|nr:carboxypeptidase regulatory-like domain-containing protein [Bacteroidales bacterium]
MLIFIGLSSVRAQSITGKVIDQQGNAMEFANVVLLSKADSTALAGTITDSTGAFSLQSSAAMANTCLRLSFVGYKPQTLCEVQPDMGSITLESASQNIDEV